MNSTKNKVRKRDSNGFSIMEVVIAIGILSVSFVTLISLFAFNTRMEINSRNKIIASYLAQEAIEVVRQTRDNNWSNNAPNWNDNIFYGDDIIIAMNNESNILYGWEIVNGNAAKQKVYLYNDIYFQSKNASINPGWKETPFSRHLVIEDDLSAPTDVIKITAYVSYGSGEVRVVSYLYDEWH
ncbi:MAG: hypothetical protein PHI66_01940 [Candidatus Pacebacteria bacterium]|nr:hypothetical protein [Candidatus Paceibacterota bacterium]